MLECGLGKTAPECSLKIPRMGVYGTTWLESAQPFLEKNLPIPATFGTESEFLVSVLFLDLYMIRTASHK